MASIIAQPIPHLDCTCGERRTYPVERLGLPPIGVESFCTSCSLTWRLVQIGTDNMTGVTSWQWVDFPEPRDDEPVKSTVAAETHETLVTKLLGIDQELMLGLAMLGVGRAEGTC